MHSDFIVLDYVFLFFADHHFSPAAEYIKVFTEDTISVTCNSTNRSPITLTFQGNTPINLTYKINEEYSKRVELSVIPDTFNESFTGSVSCMSSLANGNQILIKDWTYEFVGKLYKNCYDNMFSTKYNCWSFGFPQTYFVFNYQKRQKCISITLKEKFTAFLHYKIRLFKPSDAKTTWIVILWVIVCRMYLGATIKNKNSFSPQLTRFAGLKLFRLARPALAFHTLT